MTSEELEELLAEAYEHLEQGRYRMALSSAQKVYNEKQSDIQASICLAWALLENGFPAQSLEVIDSATLLPGDQTNTRLYRGYLLMRMSLFEGALEDLNWVILRKPRQLSWAYLNKARTLGGMGRNFEGLEEIDKAIDSSGGLDEKLLKIKDWFKKSLSYGDDVLYKNPILKHSYLSDGEEAFRSKEFWFSLWAARDTLSSPLLSVEHNQAHLLELESLSAMFQLNNAIEKAEKIKNLFKNDPRFLNIYQRINKSSGIDVSLPGNEESFLTNPPRTDFETFENKFFKIYRAKTYDLIENLRSGKRTYLLQFNEDTIKYIGVEFIIDNPFYGNKNISVEGMTVWHLNSTEVGRHIFNLEIKKDWKLVEFVQSWGTDSPGFWKEGQGRVDIFLDNYPICSRWFLVGRSEVVNFEENGIEHTQVQSLEKQYTEQPGEVITSPLNQQESKSLEELLSELDAYIGLQSVKQSMRDFVNYLSFINERKKHGLKTQETLQIHSVFLGNPGTGKTTVARLLGKIFKAMGLLKNGHVIEVDRSGLVGQYIGETAQKTNKVINQAVGGLLFIDEAYSLKKEGSQQDFGQEAIDVLIKRMEDQENEFVVIAAGYPDEMNYFINSNPGLKSRFTHFFNFEDYSPEELTDIFRFISSKEEYDVAPEAIEILKKQFTDLYRRRDKTFGNARLVRNYFNEAKINLSKRYLQLPTGLRTKETMTTFHSEDITTIIESGLSKQIHIGIDEDALNKILVKVENLIGLDSVKKEIQEIIKLCRFYSEQGENIQEKFSSHLIFLGNPGTGKTTVARLFGELYSALGILPKGHLVEVDRQGLVASYVGQTAEKTKSAIDKALGGTLFIDEAYSLIKIHDAVESDFGKEALDTLLKRMEDDRGKFVVIAAGYTEEMNKFLTSNPGLQSRFTRKIVFEDYSPDEMMAITKKLFENKNYILDEDAVEPLRKYFVKLYRNRDKNFGNARIARDLVETALKNHMLRIADFPFEERHEEVLKYILLQDLEGIISQTKERENIRSEGDPELLSKYLDELYQLSGLDSVKKSVTKLISSLRVAKLRKQRGLKVIPKNLNSVFAGNSGTGKSTVAKLLSKIYKELGIIEKGQFVQVDRSAFASEYREQTAAKTNSVVDKSLGGVLYVNNAYSLFKSTSDSDREAIDTLLKRMEEDRGKFIVIVAGFPNEMADFLNSKPGMNSRFPNYLIFEDYTPRQMLDIALIISNKHGYVLDEGAWQLLLEIFLKLYNSRKNNFGNARIVKNILYNAITNQEERILTIIEPDDNDLNTITYKDVEKIEINDIIT